MNILFLIDNLGSGGAQRQMVNLALLLEERGFKVSFVCYSDSNFFAPIVEKSGIRIYWFIEKNYISRVLVIRKFIRKKNFDVILSFLEVPNFLNCISAIGGKKWKTITTELSSKNSTFLSLRGKLFAWFQRYSDAIICNSENSKSLWLQYYPKYRQKLLTIYNPVLFPGLNSNYYPKRNDKLHIVIAASYQYLKNPIGLIKALSLLDKKERNMVEVNWYGRIEVTSGDRQAYDESLLLISDFNLQGVINLHSETMDIVNRMNEADVVALFSRLEGLPNAICEGMKLGKPILMSKVSDYSILVDEKNGFLCEWENPESIKNAIISMANLPDYQLFEMGKRSKERAEVLFSEDKIVNQWEEVLKS